MSPLLLQVTTTTTLLLLVFLFLTPSTTTAYNIVVDHEGHPLVAGQYYNAVPIIATHKGGGLTMFNNGSVVCPDFIVARSTKGSEFGIPLRFDPQTQGPNKKIDTSSNLSIAFKYLSPQPLCRRRYTSVWAIGEAFVVLDGEKGRSDSLFKLEKQGDHLSGPYKILPPFHYFLPLWKWHIE